TCQPNIGGQRKIDVTRPESDYEHLRDPGNHRKDGEREPGRYHSAGAIAVRECDRRKPNQQGAEIGPNPRPGKNFEPKPHDALPSVRLISARAARTIMRIAPCAPTCQSGETRMKLSNEPARVRVNAPITAPIGETRPPTNSPPPRMTPAIERRVYPLPMLASAEVVMPTRAIPDRTPNTPVSANKAALAFNSDQPARSMARAFPPAP